MPTIAVTAATERLFRGRSAPIPAARSGRAGMSQRCWALKLMLLPRNTRKDANEGVARIAENGMLLRSFAWFAGSSLQAVRLLDLMVLQLELARALAPSLGLLVDREIA